MESVTADTQRQQQLLRTKVPRLRYGNAPSPLSPFAVHSVPHNSPDTSQMGRPIPPTSPSLSWSTLSPASAQFSLVYSQSLSSASISSDSLNVPSPSYDKPARPTKGKSAKAKMTSLWGFFTIKEPSQQAWMDYQASIKKQQADRRSRSPNVGVPMVSSAKLPSSVPAVNSKWDGVPQGAKERRESGSKECRERNDPDRDSRSRSFSLHRSRKTSSSVPTRRSSAQHSHLSQNNESTMPQFSLQTVNDAIHRSGVRSASPFRKFGSKPSQASTCTSPKNPLPTLAPATPEFSTAAELDPLKQLGISNLATRPSSSSSHESSAGATAFVTSNSKPFSASFDETPRPLQITNGCHHSPASSDIQLVEPLNDPSEVTLSSKGPNILPPPFSARRGRTLNLDVEALGIPSALASQAPPRASILKKSTPITPEKVGMHHLQLPCDQTHIRDRMIAPWPSPGEAGQFTFA